MSDEISTSKIKKAPPRTEVLRGAESRKTGISNSKLQPYFKGARFLASLR